MDAVVDALQRQGSRRAGDNWTCPAHEDSNPSLSVSEGDDGRALLHCHAGCTPQAIVGALGLGMADLFPDATPCRRRNGDGKAGLDSHGPGTTYEYRDEQGQVLSRVRRGPIRNGRKTFWQERPDGQGGWLTGKGAMDGVRRVLFRLPELLAADASETVYVAEGEKDALRLIELGFVATTNPEGAEKWKCDFNAHLAVRNVVILEDNDAAGRKHGADVARQLRGVARSVRVLALPGLPEKGDVSDWLNNGGSAAELRRLAETAPEWQPKTPKPLPGPRSAAAGLPEVVTTNRRPRDVTDDALAALYQANDPPALFVRSGALVRIRQDEAGRPIIDRVGENELRGALERAANFLRIDSNGKSAPVMPPLEIVRDVASQASWGFPALVAVVEVPVLRPDGTVLTVPGYDAATGLFYAPAPSLDIPLIPEAPTQGDVLAAVALLDELLEGFPFDDAQEAPEKRTNRANAFALLLTPSIRQMAGPAPVAIIDAPQAGTGKSLLGELVGIIDGGTGGAMVTAPTCEAEWSKLMTSLLAAGSTLVILDNVESTVSSAALASTLTADVRADRLLGRNDQRVAYPNRATWLLTGNNVRVGGDLPRRCYWIRLDARTSRPWKRDKFLHPDLKAWARASRGDLVGALLTLVRGWFAAGCPKGSAPRFGSFDRWAETVGGVLDFAGVRGFLATQDECWDLQDETSAEWEAFLTAWKEGFKDEAVTIFRLFDVLLDETDAIGGSLRKQLPQNLAAALAKMGPILTGRPGFSRKLGIALSQRKETRYGEKGIHLKKAGDDRHKGAAEWVVCCDAEVAEVIPVQSQIKERPLGSYGTPPGNLPHLPHFLLDLDPTDGAREPDVDPSDVGF